MYKFCYEQEKTIQYLENKSYLRSISDWFLPYKDHAAVRVTKELVREDNFFHIRPLKAVLDLESILNDDSHVLNPWARETVRFARESRFDEFFHTQKEQYGKILDYVNSCDFDTWISYVENYFRSKPKEFHLIICPIAGNYGFNVTSGRKEIAFQIRFMEVNHRLFPGFDISAEYERQRKMFIFIEDFVEFLKKFEKSRTTFGDCYKNSIEGILRNVNSSG